MSDTLFSQDDILDCPICNNLYNSARTENDLLRPCMTCDCYDDGNGGADAWFSLAQWKKRLGDLPTVQCLLLTHAELVQRVINLEQIILDITQDVRTKPYLDVGDIRCGVTSKRASRNSMAPRGKDET